MNRKDVIDLVSDDEDMLPATQLYEDLEACEEDEVKVPDSPELFPASDRKKPEDNNPQWDFWVFTINNPNKRELAFLSSAADLQSIGIKAIAWQEEVGEKGTQHIQGYFQTKKKLRRKALTGYTVFARAYLDPRRGTHDEAIAYVSKDSSRKPFGVRIVLGDFSETHRKYGSGQGARNDWAAVFDMLKQGAGILDIGNAGFERIAIGCSRGVQAVSDAAGEELLRQGDTYNEVYIGPPGSGKTHDAWERLGGKTNPSIYKCGNCVGDTFIRDYNPWKHTQILCDDTFLPADTLKLIMDDGPCRIKAIGKSVSIMATTIIFTNNEPVHLWFDDTNIVTSVLRRCDKYVIYDGILDLDDNKQPTNTVDKRSFNPKKLYFRGYNVRDLMIAAHNDVKITENNIPNRFKRNK